MTDLAVAVADDDPIVREALSNVLMRQRGIRVVATLASGEEAVTLVNTQLVDVVLMDLNMPGMGGLAAAAEIKSNHPSVRVIILSALNSQSQERLAKQLGVDEVAEKTMRASDIVGLVKGGAPETRTKSERSTDRLAQLTERELQIVGLLCEGKSNQEIAATLYLSESRVKSQLGVIMHKLGVETRLQAVVAAFRAGLTSL
ncbi:MAG TPA: response regulator transcription factor [Candidatus Luteococcus avicola]|nr:response regulator transcription factor [Candidatus Luteococcus avicola]